MPSLCPDASRMQPGEKAKAVTILDVVSPGHTHTVPELETAANRLPSEESAMHVECNRSDAMTAQVLRSQSVMFPSERTARVSCENARELIFSPISMVSTGDRGFPLHNQVRLPLLPD
jgi:hypothetical protein